MSSSMWVIGGSSCHGGLRMLQGLLKVKPLRIIADTDLTLGLRKLETALGQGSVWWEQHPVLTLSVRLSGYLLPAQGAGLGEPLVCPSTDAMVPPALHQPCTHAWQGVSGVCSHRALILLQQFILFFFFLFTAVTIGILLCSCLICLHQHQEVCAGTTEVSSHGSRGDQITSPGSSAGTALGTSCILLNGRCVFQRELL